VRWVKIAFGQDSQFISSEGSFREKIFLKGNTCGFPAFFTKGGIVDG
jgi:hypothetical protein